MGGGMSGGMGGGMSGGMGGGMSGAMRGGMSGGMGGISAGMGSGMSVGMGGGMSMDAGQSGSMSRGGMGGRFAENMGERMSGAIDREISRDMEYLEDCHRYGTSGRMSGNIGGMKSMGGNGGSGMSRMDRSSEREMFGDSNMDMGSSGMRNRNLSGGIQTMERGMSGSGLSGDMNRGMSGGMDRAMSGGMDRGFTIGMNKESSTRMMMDNESHRGMSGTGHSFGMSGGMSSGFGRMRAADSFGTSVGDFGSSNSQMQRNTGIDMDFRNKRVGGGDMMGSFGNNLSGSTFVGGAGGQSQGPPRGTWSSGSSGRRY